MRPKDLSFLFMKNFVLIHNAFTILVYNIFLIILVVVCLPEVWMDLSDTTTVIKFILLVASFAYTIALAYIPIRGVYREDYYLLAISGAISLGETVFDCIIWV